MVKLSSEFEVVCPCCGATQTVDPHLKRVVGHRAPAREDTPKLDQAHRILAEEAERREALFKTICQRRANPWRRPLEAL